MRNGDGKFELTPAILGTIIATCLAIGSGGAFYAVRGGATSAKQDAAVTQSSLLDVRVAILEERARLSAEALTEIKQSLREIQAGVLAVDKRIERHVENGRMRDAAPTAPAPR